MTTAKKMPAASRILAADAARVRDKRAIAALKDRGEEFNAETLASELAAILAREAGIGRKGGMKLDY